jgi:F-type H+-transporting ATPase subunit b
MRPLATLVGIGTALLTSSAFAEEGKKGMPQLDFHNPLTISQVVWLAIIFFGLYLLLSKWALPQVAEVLDQRAAAIAADLDAARGAKAKADTAVVELTEATRTAQATARGQVAAAVDSAKISLIAQAAAFDARLNAQLAEAERRISAARVASVGALRQVAIDTTGDVVMRLTGTAANPQAVGTAVDAALAARRA